MKSSVLLAAALVIFPLTATADVTEAPERCITASSGVSATSDQLKALATEMGWDLGTFKSMKVAGVVKGKTMSSKSQVDVCLKSAETALNYQIRVGAEDAAQLAWDVLSDKKL